MTKRGIRLEDGILGRCLENCQGFQDGHFLKFGGCFFLRFKVRLDQCTLQSLCGAYESGVFRENLAKSEAPSKDFPPKRPVATFPAISTRISVDHACVLEVWKPTAVRQHRLGPPGSSKGRLAEWDLVNPRCLPQAIWGLYFVFGTPIRGKTFLKNVASFYHVSAKRWPTGKSQSSETFDV